MVQLPAGDWVTVDEAMALIPDVSRRRIQALAKNKAVKTKKVLGRLLFERKSLIAWRDTRNRKGGWTKGKPRR
jgi:hypothetical protein